MFLVVQSIFNDWSGLVLPIQVNSEDECLRIKPSPSRGSVVFPAASDGSQRSACPGRRAPPRPPSPWSARGWFCSRRFLPLLSALHSTKPPTSCRATAGRQTHSGEWTARIPVGGIVFNACVNSPPHSGRARDSTGSFPCLSCEWILPPSAFSPRPRLSRTLWCCWAACWHWPERGRGCCDTKLHYWRTEGGGDWLTALCVHLAAFENCLGHKHTHFHIHVVLRPAVVLSHCTVVALGVGLELSLAPENWAWSVNDYKAKRQR